MFDIKSIASSLLLFGILSYSYAQNKLTVPDTRAVVTTPTSYAQSFEVHFKQNTTIGIPVSNFSTVLGLRGWYNDSGGKAHELAFSNSDLYYRSGFNSGWEVWRKILAEDINGNIGIGTTSPVSKLDVRGSINASDYIRSQNPDNNEAVVFLGWLNNVPRLRIGGTGVGSANGFDIQLSGDVSVMRLLANGNVGIGTTTPGTKLAVNGTIRAKEVKVESGWADYVFDEDYKLLSLTETELFIKKNKHLPGIPSEEEVQEEGLSLGEMNKKLLEKIEELTLHVITLNKELSEVKQQLKKREE
ncbi:hypothetical protein RYH73_06445 [Olivibacter sp. CPCC 100613]|uniref:hypothetical protein n=1 Tax=Olivibacter sp. CPCC 100613 TaxID=3079931 RepID=UPI002FF78C01